MGKSADGVYRRKDRDGFWISWADAQGRRRWRKTHAQTLTQARAARAAELVRVEQSKVLGFAAPGEESFADLTARFLIHQKARLSNKAYTRESGLVRQHLQPFFAGRVSAIRRVDIQRYITKRCAEVSPYSVQKEINSLKHLLRLAIEWEIIPFSPPQGVKCPKVPAGRVRYLHQNEFLYLLQLCPDWLRPLVVLAVTTGMRRSEILSIRWIDVDAQNRRILLSQTKNGDGRIVYLNDTALAAISSLATPNARKPLAKLFHNFSGEKVSVAFARACKRGAILDFRFHDLRHTAASWLRMKGADIHTVAQLLGHKDLRMAARYQHLSPAFLGEAVARLDEVFGSVRYQGVTEPRLLTNDSAVTA